MTEPRIVLASTSRYRAALLHRLVDVFEQVAPTASEAALEDETPRERAQRLARFKAQAVARRTQGAAIVIGSDQVAALGSTVLHKPGDIATAREQLHASSGKTVDFFTGVCVIRTRDSAQGNALDHTHVMFRRLTDAEIEHYLVRERPLDCAGGFKMEKTGVALCERIESEDPTALIGLPLIALARLLRDAGIAMP